MKSLKRKIKPIKGYTNYYSAGKAYTNKMMFKYMNLETALLSLNRGTLRFSEPDVWRDSFESRFYTANYQNIKHCPTTDTPKLYACCFTYQKVSEAAWTTYNATQRGLGAKCVQFVINVERFRQELHSALNGQDCIYEGRIDYSLGDSIISQLHTPSSSYHNEITRNFDFALFLSLMLLKRVSFAHEDELRIFLKRDDDNIKAKSTFDVPINWANVIDRIYLAEDCTDIEMQLFLSMCNSKGIDKKLVSKQSIYGKTSAKPIIFST